MILASGCFDGLHAGHVRYLQAAAALGGPLVVAIAPDAYIRTVKRRQPYWTQEDRAWTVRALSLVDEVYLQTTWMADVAILALRPTVFVKGMDWMGKLPLEVAAACQTVGARIVFTATEARHTSEAMP